MGKRSIIATNAPKGIWPFTQGQLIYEPVAIAVVATMAYFLGVALDSRWVAIPLTATIVSTATEPASQEASFTQSLIGNLAAILVAFVTIRSLGLEHGEATDLMVTFSPLRAIGVLIALTATPTVCTLFGILQPSAAATAAIIVFLGVTPTPHTALALTLEIFLVALLGDVMRRWRAKGAPIN